MEKSDLVFKVCQTPEDWGDESTVTVGAFHGNTGPMVDQHVSEVFADEFSRLGYDEDCEGQLTAYDQTEEEVVAALRSEGFNAFLCDPRDLQN